MPFTPFHLGPACPLKAVLGRYFSLTVFGFAQVAMDVEVLVRMIRRDGVLHGFTHTYLGAAPVALVTLAVGWPACRWLVRHWPADASPFLTWLCGNRTLGWPAAVSGAVVGTYSHVLLDSVMHADMQPLWPFAGRNALRGLVSVVGLHLFCVVTGAAGILWLYGRFLRTRRKTGP